ncbi:acyl-CoA dehydrogenase family protein [Gammaproteobacteria bacterium]|nr:acyl-CoA dehydrogenase family protein [Gammaproteobacteria bacterium]
MPSIFNLESNQPSSLEPYNLFTTDPVLKNALLLEGAGADIDDLKNFGARVGAAETFEWGYLSNRHSPELVTHNRFGERIDEVHFHPSYHSLMNLSITSGLHCSHYDSTPGDGLYVARMARMFMMAQVEVGHGCSISMTGAVLPALREQPELARIWEPRIRTKSYDYRAINPAEKTGCLLGMGLTERQGGSDVRANSSRALRVPEDGEGCYHLSGHKWFTSAPMCDAFLLLANSSCGLSCFLLPRILPDGTRNSIALMRLKDKLGNRSNASSEIEYENAKGWIVGEEGRGVQTIIKMINATRIDCTIWAVALMRQAVAQAGWHVANRSAFGRVLLDQPLMENVIADLEVEVEAASYLIFRLAGIYERSAMGEQEAALARIGSAIAKYWLSKRSISVVSEALECLGGNGYVEESILPRLYREAPLNSIWEGAGNVIALDILRILKRSSHNMDAFILEVSELSNGHPEINKKLVELKRLSSDKIREVDARKLIELMAKLWSASLLVNRGEQVVAEAYIVSRLGNDWGSQFGTLSRGLALKSIAQRAIPIRP